MNKFATGAAVLSIALLPGFAPAAPDLTNPGSPDVAAGWGQMNLDIKNLNAVGRASSDIVKSKHNAWKAFAGWRVNPYLAFEGTYLDFGKHNDRFSATDSGGHDQVKMSGFAHYVIGTLSLNPFDLFAEAGGYFYDVKVKADFDSPGLGVNSSDGRADFLYGDGIDGNPGGHVDLHTEYEVIDVINSRPYG